MCIAEEGKRSSKVREFGSSKVGLAFAPNHPAGGTSVCSSARNSTCASSRYSDGKVGQASRLSQRWSAGEVLKFGCSKVWAGACTEPPCPPRQHKFTVQRTKGRASRPCLPLRGMTGEPHTSPCNANPAYSATYPPLRELSQSGADIPVCALPRGQTGMSAPQSHAPSLRLAGTASPYLSWRAFAGANPALDDSRRLTTIDNGLHLADRRLIP